MGAVHSNLINFSCANPQPSGEALENQPGQADCAGGFMNISPTFTWVLVVAVIAMRMSSRQGVCHRMF